MSEIMLPGIPDVAGKTVGEDSQLRELLLALKISMELITGPVGLAAAELVPLTGGGETTLHFHNSIKDGGQVGAVYAKDGAVELNYAGVKKLETSNTGATLTGVLVADGLTLGDNENIIFGAGPDGFLHSNGTSITFVDGSGTESMMVLTTDGSVDLYYDGVKKAATLDDGWTVKGCLTLDEISTPSPDANHGKIYTQDDDKLYFQDGAGAEHEIAFVP